MRGPTLWDRIATLGDPTKQTARVVARAQMEFLARATSTESDGYESGGLGRRLLGWMGGSAGPNAQVAKSLATTRQRHRDLSRNNPWTKRAAEAIRTHTVGHGISVEFRSEAKDTAERKKIVEFVNNLWSSWYETNACDFEGRRDGYMQQALTMGEIVRKGEGFVRARWLPGSSSETVPLKLQFIPAEFCDENKTEYAGPGKPRVIQGVELDAEGRRSRYWMFRQHPADLVPSEDPMSRPLPAKDIAHVYREDEAGQLRGMPWGHAVLVKLKELDGYEDAYLFRQKLANCFGGFVHDTDAPTLNPSAANAKTVLPDSLEPGAMAALPAGKKITFNQPPDAGDYGPFTNDVLHAVAMGYGISVPMLTGRYGDLNFTSGRMGYIDVGKNIDDWRWLMLVPLLIEPICEWFLEAVSLKYGLDLSFLYPEITPPKRELMDPPREVPAEIDALRAGLWSMPESWRSRGMRPARVIAEIKAFNQMVDEAGITLDVDPRKVNAQGTWQASKNAAKKEPSDA